jgi:4-carboxymuconolactone decarboxylase
VTDLDKHKKGVEMFAKVYGDVLPMTFPPAGQNKSMDFMLETLFADLWAGEALSFRERRLLLLGALAAQGEEGMFKIHAAAGLNNGELTVEQMQEAILFLTQYVGYPKASNMNLAIADALKKYGNK